MIKLLRSKSFIMYALWIVVDDDEHWQFHSWKPLGSFPNLIHSQRRYQGLPTIHCDRLQHLSGSNYSYFCTEKHILFYLSIFIALYFDCGGENIQRQPPVPSSAECRHMSIIMMFMQTITEIHCLKAMGAFPTGTKRSFKKSGQRKHWKCLRSYKKTSRKKT